MPVQFDTLKPQYLDIFGALSDAYGPSIARENLTKIRSLIQGQNLSNQTEQLKMPYVEPTAKGNLAKLLAETGKINTETQYIPTKYNQAGQRIGISTQRLGLDKERFNRLNSQIRLNFVKSLPQTMRNTFLAMPPEQQDTILSQYVKNNMGAQIGSPNGIPPPQGIGAPPMAAPNGSPSPSPMGMPPTNQAQMGAPPSMPVQPQAQPPMAVAPNEMFRNAAEIAANKGLRSAKLGEQKNAYEQLGALLSDKDIQDTLKRASKYAGLPGKGKAFWDAISGSNHDDYEALKDFKNILSSNYTNLTRRLEGLGVQASTRHEINNMLSGAINNWDSNPSLALKLIDRLNHQLELVGQTIEKQANPVNPLNKNFSPQPLPKLSNKTSNSPPSHDPKAFKTWLHSVPPEVAKAYIDKMK